MSWYKEPLENIYELLETTPGGLTKASATDRLRRFGPNELPVVTESLWRVIFEPFRNVFVAVLGTAAIVSLLSHEVIDAVIVATIIIVNAVIFYTQHYATNRVLRSLKKHNVQTVNVLRDGAQIAVASASLVPGDVILLSEGERIPADARVVSADNLQLNESSLTGESTPVQKHASTLSAAKQIYEQDNMLFQGTYVLSGGGTAVVVETGARTEFGKIAQLATGNETKSPVQQKIDGLIALMVKAIGVVVVIVFALALARGIPASEALRFVLSLAVSAVPEGLPVALTVIIVLGMRRMAKHKALVRSFKAIEDIGLITTIATDKTGTLTKNHLTVVDTWALDGADVRTIAAMTLDRKARATDPLDVALIEFLGNHRTSAIEKLYPFDLSLRMSGGYDEETHCLYIKGAPEHVLAKSRLSKEQRHQAESAMHTLAAKGYRVIAFGTHTISDGKAPTTLAGIQDGSITFAGFLAFADELRREAAAAIRRAHEAGIHVRLITGDHYETAYNIGKTVGLAQHPDQVVQGTELPKDQRALALAIQDKTVFSRILPEDKYRILQALKTTEITAMTGDGVNDVPALTSAHVGIAMGSGSDIARDAGDIVLLNDNFSTIVRAIAEGRKIFDNIRRMLFYLLSTSLGEICTMIGALVFGLPLPVTALQILWINLVTDTALVLPLGLEPEEEGHMQRPPRRPKDPLLSRILLSRMVVIALTMAIVTLTIVVILQQRDHTTAYIQTVAFMALIAAQWTNAFNARSEFASSFSRLKRKNYGMLVGFLVAFTLQCLVMFGPLGSIFDIQDVPLTTLLASSIIMAAAVLGAGELHKYISRHLVQQRN